MFYDLLEREELGFTNISQITEGCKSLVFNAEFNGIS